MFGKKREPKTKAGKLLEEIKKPACAKPIPGGRCGKPKGHWGKCG